MTISGAEWKGIMKMLYCLNFHNIILRSQWNDKKEMITKTEDFKI